MRIQLTNWMCYPTLDLQTEPGRVTLLNGPTGSGKSAVLDAIEWAIIGTARGFLKLKDRDAFKGDPSMATSVELEFAGDWGDWPAQIMRGQKLTTQPESAGDRIKTDAPLLSVALRTWDCLDMPVKERASVIGRLTPATIDERRIISLLNERGPCPQPGEFNGLDWGGFATIAEAQKQAVAIRASYHAGKTRQSDPEILERINEIKAGLNEDRVEKPDEKPLEEFRLLMREVADLQAQYVALNEMGKNLAGFILHMDGKRVCTCGEFDLNKIIERLVGNPQIALKKQIEQRKARQTELEPTCEATTLNLKRWRSEEGKRVELSRELAALEKVEQGRDESRSTAAKRSEAWVKIAARLEPDGPIQREIGAEVVSRLDFERLEWAAKLLDTPVTLTASGDLLCRGRNARQPSRGQRLIASLIVRDALAQAIPMPVLLVDELETVDFGLRERVLDFLNEIAEDYEAVFACLTGPLGYQTLGPKFNVLAARGGQLKSLALESV